MTQVAQSGCPGLVPSVCHLHLVQALGLEGQLGSSCRGLLQVEQFGSERHWHWLLSKCWDWPMGQIGSMGQHQVAQDPGNWIV